MADDKVRLILEAVDETDRAFRRLQGKLRDLEGAAGRTERRFSSLTDRLNASFSRLRRSVFTLKNAIIGAFTVGSVGMFMRSVTSVASEIEILKLRLRAVGQDGEKAFQELHAWASRLPISTKEAIDMFITLQAYGLRPSIDQMNILVDTILAMGGSEEVLQRIGLALGQIYTRGKLAAQEMIQLSNAGIPIREILAEGLGVTTQELEELLQAGIDAQTALNIIFSGLERRFGGTAKEFEGTWDGVIARLKSVWFDFRAAVADTGAFDRLKAALEQFVNWATSKEGWAVLSDLAKFTGEAILAFVDVSIGAIQLLIGFVDKLQQGFRALAAALDILSASAGGFMRSLKLSLQLLGGGIDVAEFRQKLREIQDETVAAIDRVLIRYLKESKTAADQTSAALGQLRSQLESIRTSFTRPAGGGRPPRRRRPPAPAGGDFGIYDVTLGELPSAELSLPSWGTGLKLRTPILLRKFPLEDVTLRWRQGMEQLKEKTEESRQAWERLAQSFEVNADAIVSSIQYVGFTIENSLLDVLDPLSEKFLDFKNLMVSIAREIYREFLRLAVIRPLLGAALSAAFPGGSVIASGSASLTRHLGGYIPRFHSGGLAKDEVFALLKRGEFVLSREAVNALGLGTLKELNRGGAPGGSPLIVNLSVNAIDPQSFTEYVRTNKGAIIAPLLEELNRNGALIQTIRANV